MRIKTLLVSTAIVIAFQSCSKEELNDHDTILGTWHIKKIIGLNGGNTAPLDFATGEYTFKADGSLEYLSGIGVLYKGRWLLYKKPDQSYTDADGNVQWMDGETVLELNADQTTGAPQKKKAYFIGFTIVDANNFMANLYPNGVATHEYSFVRKL